MKNAPTTIFTLRGHFAGGEHDSRVELAEAGARICYLDDLVSPARDQELRLEASTRASAARATFDYATAIEYFAPHTIGIETMKQIVGADLGKRFYRAMRMIEALSTAERRAALELVVVNEDVRIESKTASLWAKVNHIPSVHLSHSAIIGMLLPVHREINTDTIVLFGKKVVEAYESANVTLSDVVLSGNPAWDRYADLVSNRERERSRIESRYGIPPGKNHVLFATTWASNFTALANPSIYEDTLRAMFRAFAALPDEHAHLIVKDRSSNERLRESVTQLAREEGVATDRYTFAMDGLPALLVGAAVAVVVNSNVAIEAAMCGVPTINIWSPSTWLTGPFFDALEGVFEAPGDELATALASVLGRPELRLQMIDEATQKLSRSNVSSDGFSGAHFADLMLRTRRQREPLRQAITAI